MKYIKNFILFIIIIFTFCERYLEYEKKEQLRNLSILLQLPEETKLKEICINSEEKAINCINNPVNLNFYLSTLNNFYKINISSKNPNDYCPLIIDSPTFKEGNFSNDAKRCHFECNKQFWQNHDCTDFNFIINQYINCLPGIWVKKCENQTFKKCLENCFLKGDPIWFIP